MANVTFTYNPVPAPACYPPDLNGLAQELTSGGILNGTIPDTAGGGVTSGSTPPTSALANKLWLKTDVAGRPIGFYAYYNGNWRRVYTGNAVGEIRMFYYPPTEFDGTGRGTIGGNWDGWAICNGNNGTPDLRQNYFPVSGDYGYGGVQGWAVWDIRNGAYQTSGGQGQLGHKIDAANDLPHLRTQVWGYNHNQSTTGGPFSFPAYPGDPNAHFDGNLWDVVDLASGAVTGSAGQKALPLPNYIGFGFLMFVGYQ